MGKGILPRARLRQADVAAAFGSLVSSLAAPFAAPLSLSPAFTAPDIGALVGRSGALSVDVGSGVIRHEFSPLTVTVNGSVSPEAGREIGRGIGDQVNGYLRNHRREMLLPVEPGI